MTDRMVKIIAAGQADHQAVRLQERAKIVAWLRGKVPTDYTDPQYDIGLNLSYAIERGEHLKENDNA